MARSTTPIDLDEGLGHYNDDMSTTALTPLPFHRLDVGTYGRMVASGALEGEPVELLEGWLVDMSPQNPDHAAVIARLTRHLAHAQAWLHVQLPLEIPPNSVPEPDLSLVETEPSFAQHPRAALLVVEVTGSSHAVDRGVKACLYAQAGVPTYWLVDVPGRAVEVRTDPGPDGYRACGVYAVGASVPSPAVGVEELGVGSLFAPAGD
jgi:Uma2 family endonuclease